MASLRWRLLLAAAATILLALVVAWVFMTLLFERHLARQLHEEMTREALVLVADLSVDANGRPVLAGEPSDPRLRKPAGGAYWQLSTAAGALRSRSLWDSALPAAAPASAQSWQARTVPGPFGQTVDVVSRRLQVQAGRPPVLVQVARDLAPQRVARQAFARELATFLGGLWLVLSAAAWWQVRVGLQPLARIGQQLASLRRDAHARRASSPVREIAPLTDAINELADARQADVARARHRAADLAHALKSPLSALCAQLRRLREGHPDSHAACAGLERAVDAIQRTVDGELARAQLGRAAADGPTSSDASVVVERILAVLEHTRAGERVAFANDLPPTYHLPVAGDVLSEILGAVLENAATHARRQVRVSATAAPGVNIDDDGPGIQAGERHRVLERGVRLDEAAGEGSGLGLAIARDLVHATGGELALEPSPLGGLRLHLCWPASMEPVPP